MRRIVFAILSIAILCQPLRAERKDAMELFDKGLYSSALTLFESSRDIEDRAYAVLCAGKLRRSDFPALVAEIDHMAPRPVLSDRIHFQYALNLFAEGRFARALAEMDSLNVKNILPSDRDEYSFRKAYCLMETGSFEKSETLFQDLIDRNVREYSSASNYYLGYMRYSDDRFDEAVKFFTESSSDPRFSILSRLYIIECRFMKKDYRFAVKEGARLFPELEGERRSRLARILSESFLVLGDKSSARKYLDSEKQDEAHFTRSDWFHAGSVLYAVGDYKGAVEKFSKMTDRTDSLGQTANYQMGHSYIELGNKVAALNAFNDAAKVRFDYSITEDAAFNYAKLAFDLNHDAEGFKAYLRVFSDVKRGDQIYAYMALAELVNKDYEAALDFYGKMDFLSETERMNYSRASFLRGGELASAGAWSSAIPHFRAAGVNLPRTDQLSQLSRFYLAQACYKTGRPDEARKIYTDLYNTSALRGMPQESVLPYYVAWCFVDQQSWTQAARWLDIALAGGGTAFREDALLRRADCDFYRRDWTSAYDAYGRCVSEFGPKIFPLLRQAQCCALKGDNSGRIRHLLMAKAADGEEDLRYETLHELGKAYLDAGSYSSALSSFDALLSVAPDATWTARAHIGEGMAYRAAKKYDRALENFKKVVETVPGTQYATDALTAIEAVYQATGRPELYLQYVRSGAVNKTPEQLERISFDTAEQLFLSGRCKDAGELCQKYLSEWPEGAGRARITFYLAECRRAEGEKELALEAYAEAANAAVRDSALRESAWAAMASLSYELEKFPEAYNAYKNIYQHSSLDGVKSPAMEGMMRSAWKARNYENALSASAGIVTTEASYIRAKSLLCLSRRMEAMAAFKALADADPGSAEGAEARFILVQDAFDRADYDTVDKLAYGFAEKAGSQTYWLARAFIVLGESFAARGNISQARATLESVRDGYTPESGKEDDINSTVTEALERLSEK